MPGRLLRAGGLLPTVKGRWLWRPASSVQLCTMVFVLRQGAELITTKTHACPPSGHVPLITPSSKGKKQASDHISTYVPIYRESRKLCPVNSPKAEPGDIHVQTSKPPGEEASPLETEAGAVWAKRADSKVYLLIVVISVTLHICKHSQMSLSSVSEEVQHA